MNVNNCPACGGKVEFSPDDNALKCVKCQKIFPIPKGSPVVKKSITDATNDEGYKEWEGATRFCQCTNCGAKIVLNRYEMSTKCQYCNTASLVPVNELPGLIPDGIIPFKITKEQAKIQFAERVKHKMFIPRKFVKNLPKLELGATYISSFDFAFNTFSRYSGMQEITHKRTNSDGKEIEYVETVPFTGVKYYDFDDVIIETSDKISQKDINVILPYNYHEVCKFNPDYLKGYSVGYYNQTVEEGLKRAKKIADGDLYSMIKSEYESADEEVVSLQVDTTYSNEKFSYLLVPIYFINYKYNNHEYLNLMNGQNGNVGGKFPKSKLKIALFAIFVGLIVVGIPLAVILATLIGG